MLYEAIKMNDFDILDVTEKYYSDHNNFEGTFDGYSSIEIYETCLDIIYNGTNYSLKIRLDDDISEYHYVDNREARGMLTEILSYLILELTNSEKSNLEKFVAGLNSFQDTNLMALFIYDDYGNKLSKINFSETMGGECLNMIKNHSTQVDK